MSVHGEYQRTLRVVEVRLVEAGDALGVPWREAFSAAQLDAGRDLSTAARAALELVGRIEAVLDPLDAQPGGGADERAHRVPDGTSRLTALRSACDHLRAHCRAILGPGDTDR